MTSINGKNELIDTEGVATSASPMNGNSQPEIDNKENPVPAESPTVPPKLTTPVEADPLEGFNPDDYKNGVKGDERFHILDLYLGYLVGQDVDYNQMKTRDVLVKWDSSNRPPLGITAINAHVKANHTKWLHHHYLHRTGTWAGVKVHQQNHP